MSSEMSAFNRLVSLAMVKVINFNSCDFLFFLAFPAELDHAGRRISGGDALSVRSLSRRLLRGESLESRFGERKRLECFV